MKLNFFQKLKTLCLNRIYKLDCMGDNSKHYIIDYNIAFTRSISTQFFGVDDFSKVFVYIPSRSDFLTML